MSGLSEILDVAIGLVFVFLLLSLTITWVQEFIAMFFALRSKHLINAIQNLLDPSTEKLDGLTKIEAAWKDLITAEDQKIIDQGTKELSIRVNRNLLKTFYEHPIIKSLGQPKKYPSYIDAKDFGSTIFDILLRAGTDATQSQDVIKDLEAGIEKIGNVAAREAFLALLEGAKREVLGAEKQVAKARENIEAWFNSAMERASGWYKRTAQLRAIWLGIILAILVNADTIGLAETLWRDSLLRETVSSTAVAWVAQDNEQKANEARAELEELGLPLGWSFQLDDQNAETPKDPRDFPVTFGGWVLKVGGLALTGFAISFGSPIWFDLLNRLVNIRGTGKKPD